MSAVGGPSPEVPARRSHHGAGIEPVSTSGGPILSDSMELLQQRVSRHQEKLEHATGVLDLTRARFDTSSAAYADADRARARIKKALKLAKRRAARLAKEAAHAKQLARETKDDRDDAETELAENLALHDKRRVKLAKAQAALAAAEAEGAVEESPAPTREAAPARRTATRKSVATKAAPAKKAPAKRAASSKRATAARKVPARKR